MADITKGEFARRRNVTPGRVSQWIASGQIPKEAIKGEGRNALIDEVVALAHLTVTLNIDQRHANGLATNLDLPPAAAPAPGAPIAAPVLIDTVERQIARQRLEQLERSNREAVRNEAVANGQLCDAQDARREVGRELQRMMNRVEGSFTELAAAIAGEFKLPQRDVLHLLKLKWREIRTAAALEARERAEPLPETVGYDLGEQ
jgi:hypothetical protein